MVGKVDKVDMANKADNTPGCCNIGDLREIGAAQAAAGA